MDYDEVLEIRRKARLEAEITCVLCKADMEYQSRLKYLGIIDKEEDS